MKLKEETINKFSNFIQESNTKEHEGFGRSFDIESAKEFNSFNPPNPVLIIDHFSKDLNLFAEEVARSYPLLNIAEDYLGKVKKITTKVQTSLIANATTNQTSHALNKKTLAADKKFIFFDLEKTSETPTFCFRLKKLFFNKIKHNTNTKETIRAIIISDS